ncbi:amidohydrolase family protein [Flavobacterium sp. GSB-24]|uniref:amidohydrolase family protein n=1 Tax=Flavobacterium sp. GSB-24 TaxID=2994319 RepID=UPI0024936099|nr:amidohydrolase family protein [Flavobacterium sp. GSB-24]
MVRKIDIHTHLFNLKYLPVAGILKRYAEPYITHNIAIAIERLLISHTDSMFDNSNENFDILKKQDSNHDFFTFNKNLEINFLERDFYQIKKEIVNVIPDEQFLEPEIITGLQEFQTEAILDNFLAEDEIIDFTMTSSFLLEQNQNIFQKLRNLFERLIEWLCTKVKQLANYFKWFRFMQRSEEEILNYLVTKDEKEVDLYIHHMMDVDNFFNDNLLAKKYNSYFDFAEEQIQNMYNLNKKYNNKIFGFVAFDPSKKDCIEIIKNAIENKGFKGIKFYPPMGYRSYDDPQYKERIEDLFQYCISKSIPLFAHCNKEGFESQPTKHSGYNSSPMYWLKTLKKYPELRLCLAHAGGGEGWFSNVSPQDEILESQITDLLIGNDANQTNWNSSYAKIVFKLCVVYKNVYCDVAYLDELTHVGEYSNLRVRLLNLFRSEPIFSKKIIYGSDWHMLFQEGVNQVYISNYIKLFNEIGFSEENRDDFFRKNALNYLNLLV